MPDALKRQALYTLDDVRALVGEATLSGSQPRVHPNGFIQLDLLPTADEVGRRLHIWNPPGFDMPHQATVNEVHDHAFDMCSTVVRGLLVQWLYEFVIGGVAGPIGSPRDLPEGARLPTEHELYRAVYDGKSSSRLEPVGIKGFLRQIADVPVRAGSSYTQPAYTFHDTYVEGTVVTVMEKVAVYEDEPHVVCPVSQPPDNDFDRQAAADVGDLWDAVRRSLA